MILQLHAASDEAIRSLMVDPEGIEDFINGDAPSIDLDKAWHAIHFLLSGSAWSGAPPLDLLLRSGSEIGDIDVGYGPARAFSNTETKAFADALSAVSGNELMGRYDGENMMRQDIYPQIWDRDREDDYIIEYFDTLKRFVGDTARNGLGLVISLA